MVRKYRAGVQNADNYDRRDHVRRKSVFAHVMDALSASALVQSDKQATSAGQIPLNLYATHDDA
jgi:hypothetical protein